ncbi:MAG: FAD-dependent oxidoreductase [Brevundimonas sp.]|uniref:NAD(P)/FAD-dependent oxidoreductase n=1 Tax=Brevundimonas sp. TaxID=1871086 RepID=UPI0024893CEE|nr:FAD-dependent oxidoreductase [Brevundimonas sp.]MDI1328494.1 FAD-dependent oxidoreductase [Brevundimonas sp.]
MSDNAHIVIVGAGHAGGTAAALLRQYRHAGDITLIGAEPLAPYQRPPLSKAWLKGEADGDGLRLKAPEWYAENHVDLRLSQTVEFIDRTRRTVRLSDGDTLAYDRLILATGARARLLNIEGADLNGVTALRTAADAEALKAALDPDHGHVKRLVVIGGGYVGLEVAASARALGAEVAIVERENRILARVACPVLSRFFQSFHRERGVRFILDATVERLIGEEGRVAGAQLDDGSILDCDAVLIGIGAAPNDELAQAAGLDCQDGVVVDRAARTSDPAIFAIGDVTRRPMPLSDTFMRLESVPNALEQARQAVAAITGRPAPEPEIPWFWSDQYDLKLQIAGVPVGCDDMVVRGDPGMPGFALFHMAGDLIQAVEAVNAPGEFMVGRQLIGRRTPVSRERLADRATSMKTVAL